MQEVEDMKGVANHLAANCTDEVNKALNRVPMDQSMDIRKDATTVALLPVGKFNTRQVVRLDVQVSGCGAGRAALLVDIVGGGGLKTENNPNPPGAFTLGSATRDDAKKFEYYYSTIADEPDGNYWLFIRCAGRHRV